MQTVATQNNIPAGPSQIPVVSRDCLCFLTGFLLVLINCISEGFLGVSSDSFPLRLFFLHALSSHMFSIHQLSPVGPSSFLTSSMAFEILSMSLRLILEDLFRSVMSAAIVPLGFLGAQRVENLPAVRETWVWSLGPEDPLEKGMAAQSSIFAWRIPQTEEPGWPQSKIWTRLSD